MGRQYSIGELAELTGLSRRTIRFYVQQGLLAPPEGAGRGHFYSDDHLHRLQEIGRWQEAGLSLREIAEKLEGGQAASPPPAGQTTESGLWLKISLLPGCEIHLEAGRCRMSPARLARLREAVLEVLPELGPDNPGPRGSDEDE